MAASDAWRVVVLAAGQGRRMGGPKALMTVGGRPWWRVQEERLSRAGVERLWVVSPHVAEALTGVPAVMSNPDAPMFESVRAGVAAAARGGVFILPVDVPAPDRGTFDALAAAAGSGVAIPTYRGERGHPVALSGPWIERVFARAGGADPRLDQLIKPHAVEVAVDDPAVLVNLNTPEDVEHWEASR